jgi:hypothetical protein
LLAVVTLAAPTIVRAEDEVEILVPEAPRIVSRAAPLRTSQAGIDPDTVWIGHIADPNWRPRDRNGNVMSAAAFPAIANGGYGPYHVGRGDNRPGIGPGSSYNGVWDWDHFQPGEQDSLMGWWPLARPYQGGSPPDDKIRPFFGFDYGNFGNYVINQGLKRTFGVTGYWHRDVGKNSQPLPDTGSVIPGPNVEWRPISGGASAWCGLRGQGDMTHIDPITGNPYNQSILNYHGNNSAFSFASLSDLGTDTNYPGYGSQWDQLLYQDMSLASNADLHVSFAYATHMSRGRLALAGQRIGYFYMDPTKVPVTGDGNFISAADAENAGQVPVDSFMVYVGLPVNEASCRYADGAIRPVYDPQRRWFSEVLRLDTAAGLGSVQELLTASGETGTMAGDGTITPALANLVVPSAVLAGKLGLSAAGGTVRLVFRIKTNRGFDDEDFGFAQSYSSQTRGAAIIDDVSVTQGGPNLAHFGDFEAAGAIDNRVTIPATAAWKSTGKPPGVYVHVHTVDPAVIGAAPWNDPCSPPVLADPGAAYRRCNMVGNVLTGGDHDNAEKPGGEFGAPDQDRARWAASPTINLRSNGPGNYNAMGIDREIAQTTDIVISYEVHTAGFRGNVNGNFYSWGFQSYPARQANGLEVWGEVRHNGLLLSAVTNTCILETSTPQRTRLVLTSNEDGVPDSIRVYIHFLSRCYNFSHTSLDCSPSTGVMTGNHIDNVSVGLVHGPPAPGAGIVPGVGKFVDAFPATATTVFTGSSFDTCAALVRSAVNKAQGGTSLGRPAVLGDSAYVLTDIAPDTRVDLVFRILPGVGNYVHIGNRASGIRKVPTSTVPAVANAASRNFWESYLAYNGAFGTTYPGNSHAMPGGKWDPNGWCSARMDTAEWLLFPCLNLSPNATALQPGIWVSTYHEDDPRYTTLGIAKNRCFIVDPSLGTAGCNSKTTTDVKVCNIICGSHPVSSQFPPLWTDDLSSGLSLTESGLPRGQTYEFTKIIPDGQLTPGAHVQYFYRREPGQVAAVDYLPDTNFVFNPASDAARWYHFSVLPDRWKDQGFGGDGMACLLVNDMADGELDEFFWVSAADSIGLTSAIKRGAHNGWRARGDQGVALLGNVGGDDSIARRDNGGQAGSRWDLWNGGSDVAGLANRAAAQPLPGDLEEGMTARTGPTGDMLRNFYRNLVFLTGSSTVHVFGRVTGRTNDDIAMLNNFATDPAGTAKPRSVYLIGPGFCEALTDPLTDPPEDGAAFLGTYFGVILRNTSYRTFSGNRNWIAQYAPGAGTAVDQSGSGFGLSGMKFGLSDGCGLENDVLQVNTAVPTASAQMFYDNVGGAGPYVGAVYAPSGTGRDQITYLDGTRIGLIGNVISFDPQGNPILPMGPTGRRAYLFKSLTASMSLDCLPALPVGVGDDPVNLAGSAFVNQLKLGSSNPMRSGAARIVFGLARSERVEVRIYDVTGRLVKKVADRPFVAGAEHVLIWDGTNDAGERVRSGVYFYRLETPTWTSQKKLTLLTN